MLRNQDAIDYATLDPAGLETVRLVENVTGRSFPATLFPAIITGAALPQHTVAAFPNQPLIDPLPGCTDPSGVDDCGLAGNPDPNGFYEDEFLPCGVWPVRYRWSSAQIGIDSELCGYRINEQGAIVPWRQAMYAVNTAHVVAQDRKLHYPYVRQGTPVIMGFGPIGAMTGDVPAYGFFFYHMADPLHGTRDCPGGGGGEECCCCQVQIFDNPVIYNYGCMSVSACAQYDLSTPLPPLVCEGFIGTTCPDSPPCW